MTFDPTRRDFLLRRKPAAPACGGALAAGRASALALALLWSGGALLSLSDRASAQEADCARLRAALAAPAQVDPGAAAAANKVRYDLDRASGYAHSIGCDNQQFLFFGQAPPPQCGGLKARIAGLRAQYDALRARATGDSGQRRALAAHYNAVCVQSAEPVRQRNFWETLFGGGNTSEEPTPGVEIVPATPLDGPPSHGSGAMAGSQALCVRTCDGGYFPLSFSSHSASPDELTELCKALCPNAEVKLYSRSPDRDISTAMGIDGTPYNDLPNALKFTKALVPDCSCKPPKQSWVEALAHAEELLNEMGGAKASDNTVTEQQSREMAQPLAVKPGKKGAPSLSDVSVIAPPPVVSPLAQTPPAKTVETTAPDGSSKQIRVVGPKL